MSPLSALVRIVIDSLFRQSFPQIFLQNSVFTGIMSAKVNNAMWKLKLCSIDSKSLPKKCLFVFAFETTLIGGTGVRPRMRKQFVDFVLEMLHDQMVLLFPILILGLGLKTAQFTGVSRAESVGIFWQFWRRGHRQCGGRHVQHDSDWEKLFSIEYLLFICYKGQSD